jgi:hypothetical protein
MPFRAGVGRSGVSFLLCARSDISTLRRQPCNSPKEMSRASPNKLHWDNLSLSCEVHF